jgi:predicted enzyme related to lactoylglutathione lyase
MTTDTVAAMTSAQIGHLDMASDDPAASADFYSQLFGWKVAFHEREGYTSFTDGRINGGFPDLVRGFAPVREVLQPGDVLPYVEVADLDASLEKVRELGGEVLLAATEAAPGVWLAIIRDPAGVKFALSHCD